MIPVPVVPPAPPMPGLRALTAKERSQVLRAEGWLRSHGYSVRMPQGMYVGSLPAWQASGYPASPGDAVMGEAYPETGVIALTPRGLADPQTLMHELLHLRVGATSRVPPGAAADLEEGAVDAAAQDQQVPYILRYPDAGSQSSVSYPAQVAMVRKRSANVGGFAPNPNSQAARYYRRQLVNAPDLASRQAIIAKWTRDNIVSGQRRLRMN